MDLMDRKLLDAVQRDATLTYEQLAERVGSSPSAVQRRLARLKSSHVIEGIHAVVDGSAVGCPLVFIVGLEIERKQSGLYESLQEWIAKEDSIQQAYNVTGVSDFIVIVTAATLEDYDELMARMIVANPNVRKYMTSVVLRSFKKGTLVPTMPSGARA